MKKLVVIAVYVIPVSAPPQATAGTITGPSVVTPGHTVTFAVAGLPPGEMLDVNPQLATRWTDPRSASRREPHRVPRPRAAVYPSVAVGADLSA